MNSKYTYECQDRSVLTVIKSLSKRIYNTLSFLIHTEHSHTTGCVYGLKKIGIVAPASSESLPGVIRISDI